MELPEPRGAAAPARPPAWSQPVPAPRAPAGAQPPTRNAAVEPAAAIGDADEADADGSREAAVVPPPEPYGTPSGASAPARGPRPRGVEAGTQADAGTSEWTSYDLRRSLKLLHSTNDTVVRRTLRRLHIIFWHAASAKLIEILRLAGAPHSALKLVKEIVDTCRICRMWARPTPKSLTSVRLATDFNQVVQWDILFHRKLMVSQLLDEAIRWTAGSVLKGKSAEYLIAAIMTHWVRHFGSMKVSVADGEKGLASEEVAQFLDRALIQLKTKAPGEHAQMVERHHEPLRRLLLRVEAQLHSEGPSVPWR